ncbi:sulfatase maturation enzyme AslB (radical SAM superfamily) [Rhodobium orientis]|uniref:Radical SAM core domain-containing protein n=1 Tax=Rhodobium orientis TaxID=34017 RepID=A0A327JTE2_9HYPH|nr:radical SAM protein [Rhodobium orientis]MBB4302740.1 sulfatase maturation enzyme AslB (radical SAM superfamily) [Rhodobium orientis]MBK5948521.1 hypothetical protein [Rhodobium orientis]RAI29790.1 hypothetical protein CH339_01875 [Rhodobium orientis]
MSFAAPSPEMPAVSRSPDLDTETVMFLMTEKCNLNCIYCYEAGRHKNPMSAEAIRNVIVQHMNRPGPANLSIDFFGGEPFLEFETIRAVVEWFHERDWPKGHRFTISTNGTLLNDEIKAWLAKWHRCVVPMLSLDGAPEAHNRNRSNSYDKIAPHIPFLRQYWPTQSFKMTIGPDTIGDVAAGVKHIHGLGMPVEASVIFEDVWGDAAERRSHLKTYEAQLRELVDFYAANPDLAVPQIVNRSIGALFVTREKGERWCGAGKYMSCYTPDGASYPCHRFAPLCSRRPAVDPYAEAVGERAASANCPGCALLGICPTCQGFNWEQNGDVDVRTDFHCAFFKLEVLATAKLTLKRLAGRMAILDADPDLATKVLGLKMLMDTDLHASVYAVQ